MTYPLKVIVLENVALFRKNLPEQDRVKINGSITAIRYGHYDNIYIKSLRGVIKELIIKRFRFIFFIDKNIVYFVGAFIKKTNKTPKGEIENAEKIYKLITKSI
jgi:phage-related protein